MAFEKHLLVDAANILHAWPEMRALLKRDKDTARAELIRRVSVLHDVEERRVTVVIDGRGHELQMEHPSGHATLTVVYTPNSMTADDVIERMVGRSPDPSTCEVATDDQSERSTIEAVGAAWVCSADLLARIERAEARLSAKASGLARDNAREWRKP